MSNAGTALERLLVSAVFLFLASSATAEQLALTFDDLPLNGKLPAGTTELDLVNGTLALLAARQVPAVFGFVNAQKLESNPIGAQALQRWVDAGQRVGSHTYSHLDLNTHSVEDYGRDILRNEPVLALLSPQREWRWFRYPYLREGDASDKREGVRAFLREHRYNIAQTTIDYEDYLWNTPFARCVQQRDERAMARLRATYLEAAVAAIAASRHMSKAVFGRKLDHVLLLHLGAFTPDILPRLLDLLEQQGFAIVTLETAQADPVFQTDPKFLGRRGGTLLEQHVQTRQIKDVPGIALPRAELEAICR
jgi:peptidoglycan/xylan/chitin deacetylase (PgdA/CDA1 family)